MGMKQKAKSEKFKEVKVLKKALAFFFFFAFAFSFLNLNPVCLKNLSSPNSDSGLNFFIADRAKAQELDANTGAVKSETTTEDLTGDRNFFVRGFNWILYGFYLLLSYLLVLAGLLFDWAIDANNIRDVIHRQAIYEAWKIVRDFLNLGFILILLYSAFCTVFQIEKYHLKKILLMLVLMALLVNFSFPISRFIVDASNVTMYFFLQSAFGADSNKQFSAGITRFTGIADILVPRNNDKSFDSGGSTVQILMAIFFTFCLMITMFVIAAILVIRIVALAVLIIFSSVGFVAAVFPDTKSFANSWWSHLFKYAFAGPVLVFMLLIAYNLMKEMAVEGTMRSMQGYAQNYGRNPGLLADSAYFFLPIVILWMGIFSTRTMSIFGANWVVGKATGARDWFAKIPQRTVKRAAVATGVPGGVKKAWEERKGVRVLPSMRIPFTKKRLPEARLFSGRKKREEKTKEREEKISGWLSKGGEGWRTAGIRAEDRRIGEKVKENKELNVSASQLDKDLGSADKVTRTAAAITMAEKGLLTDINRFEKALRAVGNDEDLKKKIIDKAPKEITRDVIKDSKSLNAALTAAVIKDEKGNKDKEATKRVQETIKGKIKADNNVKILIDYDEKYGEKPKSKKDAYRDNLEKLSAEDLAKQKNLLDTQEFHEFFLRDKAPGGPNEDPDFIAKTAENMNMKDRLDWRRRGYEI